MPARRYIRERPRCRHQHPVADAACLDRDSPKPNTGKNVGIVGLIDAHRSTVLLYRRERAAGADHGTTFAPSEDIDIRCFRPRRRISALDDYPTPTRTPTTVLVAF